MLAGEPDIRWVPAYTLLVHRTRRLLCLRPSNESTVDPLHNVAFQEGRRILIAHTPIPLTSWSTARAPTVALEYAGVCPSRAQICHRHWHNGPTGVDADSIAATSWLASGSGLSLLRSRGRNNGQVFETKWWAGTGLNRRHQDFQTRLHPPARTNDLLPSVMIRSLQGTNLHLCIRIRTDSDA
jgi:hypothetical protein